ncbi:probable cytochrome P450 6a13 [Diprion similis]|uniref:probable cytochrome P450 6a13 n=1 Tax=Diprion similis TaxID=362088 RepID=UPI001EF933C6|nr:probable cytochrome P450 6a13 [Diprion similis]
MWDSYTWTLLFLTGVITAVFFYIKSQFSFWSRRGVRCRKPHWFFGSLRDSQGGKLALPELLLDLYKESKGQRFAGIWEFYSPELVVLSPDLIQDILVKDFATWSSRGVTVNLDVDPLAANLVNLDGKKWKVVRSRLSPTFTSGKLKLMHNLLLECSKEFMDHLDRVTAMNQVVEVRELSAKYSTDVIGSCIFGIQMNSLRDESSIFRAIGKKIFPSSRIRTVSKAVQLHFPWLFRLLKLSTRTREVTEFFVSLTKANFKYREENNERRNDFMDLLRDLKNTEEPLNEDDIEFNDELLAAQAFIFFGAGFETSSSTLSFCLHELAADKNLQDRLRDEVRRTKAKMDGEITWDGLRSMKYLDMVFQETLRKYPPLPILVRTSVKPYRIPDTDIVLPEGTGCIVPIYALHHDPEYYPDPQKFDPERFDEEMKSQRSPFTYLPFGGGPRICIGLRFAEQQVKLSIFQLIDNFEVSLCEKSKHPLQLNPKAGFLQPIGGIWLRLSRCVVSSSANESDR